MPIKFSPCATNPCVATPNRGHVPTKPCTTTNRAMRPSESCITNIRAKYHDRAVRHEQPSRALVHAVRLEPPLRAYARHMHSTVHTPEHSAVHTAEHTHSLAQVTLNILCSTLLDMNDMFCFYLYTSMLSAGLIMWDNSQFLFFFLFSSNFTLT